MILVPSKLNVLIDGQWGSTGKGKLAGFIALRNEVAAFTSDFQSNAGHTWRSDAGVDHVVHHVPSGFVNRDAALLVNPGSTVTVSVLLGEIDRLSDYGVADRLVVHPHAGVIEPEDVEAEAAELRAIASTMKGVGYALARKVQRRARLAKDVPDLAPWIGDTTTTVQRMLRAGRTVVAESAQGFDLSLSHGWTYPFVTSRDVTVGTILSNCGVPPVCLGNVVGAVRAYPIRVGDPPAEVDGHGAVLPEGESGPCYPDQKEVTWDEVRRASGAPDDITERTTVTNRVRRVFTWSWRQFDRFCQTCAPHHLFINFVNHWAYEDYGARTEAILSDETRGWVQAINSHTARAPYFVQPRISLLGTGPCDSDMVEL